MDYLFLSSLVGTLILSIIASYDIACQWFKNFWSRHAAMPSAIQFKTIPLLSFKVPKFHLPPHIQACQAPFSFNFTKGVSKTDGEAPERNWSWLNCATCCISVMGPGGWQDTLDDFCGFSNWKKVVALGTSCTSFFSPPNLNVFCRRLDASQNGLGNSSSNPSPPHLSRIHGGPQVRTRGSVG